MGQFESIDAYLARLLNVEVLTSVAVWFALFFVFRRPLAKALGLRVGQVLLLAGAFSGILGFAIRPWDENGSEESFWLTNSLLWSIAFQIGGNWVLNALLYLPAAYLLTSFGKPWWAVVIALGTLSFGIEGLQAFTTLGIGDPADLVSNCFGAILGASLGTLAHPRSTKR